MGEKEGIFVKRVDFEVNNNEPSVINTNILNGDMLQSDDDDDDNDIEGSEVPKKKPTTCCGKFCYYMDKFGIKGALSHIGLLLGLGLYCLGGGWVGLNQIARLKFRESKNYNLFN